MNPTPATRLYFVDESGDGVLFNRKGKTLFGSSGCQQYFILGLLDVADPASLDEKLEDLRRNLLSDPYFRNVPSMQPERRKTALTYHAKDDLPEVRREVFRILAAEEMKFFAVVKRMQRVLEYVRSRNAMEENYKYHPDELYDLTVRMLFKQRLHKHERYEIIFARRGKADRTRALRDNLLLARDRFHLQHHIDHGAEIDVVPLHSRESGGLQAVDYFLWALQRLYERREGRYLEYLWPRVALIHDVDNTLEAPYGVYYTQKKPLTTAAFEQSGI